MSETVLFGNVKDPELVVYSFRGQLQCRMGGTRGSHRGVSHVLEPESSDEGQEISLENPSVDEEFRIHEEGIGNDTRAGCLTRCSPRVPGGEKNNPGNEKPPGSPFPSRESRSRKTTERIHEWLGSFVHWILGSGVFPYV